MKFRNRPRRPSRRIRIAAFCLLAGVCLPSLAGAQQPAAEGPATALSSALSAACKQDAATFADALTSDNAAAYRALPGPQRTALMKRFVLLDEPGRTLLSSSASGRTVLRCETPGFTTEMRFGETRLRENLAFIPMDIPLPGEGTRSITFGLVREGGNWKLLSVGLILLDIPSMAKQWEQADLDAREDNAIANLRAVAAALETYRRAYGDWPESLALLGPAPPGGVSPQAAGLIDADLAAGAKDGYAIRYSIVPAGGNAAAGESSKPETFVLAASPGEYGKSGRRSFFLDSAGVLHGADKQGGLANSADPRIGPAEQ
ncbi:MAG: hypothetical protein LAO08_03070 [Acidobacteriia bacterium]|nr:hypothetical protein [Terriglobia bacterium]